MVKEKRTRLEATGSIPSQRIFCMNILVQGAFGTTSGVYVTITGTKGQFEPVPLAVFLVVVYMLMLFMHVPEDDGVPDPGVWCVELL